MTDTIRVPYGDLNTYAQTIRAQAESVQHEIGVLSGVVSSLEWMGNRRDGFMSLWNEAEPNMRTWVDALNAFAEDLENQAKRMSQADQA